jgi:hypothetical protein
MATTADDPDFDPHMRVLGYVAAVCATLELEINMTIWELANVDRSVGACLTSQLFSPSSRMRVLISLLNFRNANETILKKFNRMSESITALGRRRNVFIHLSRTYVRCHGALAAGSLA